jgi:cell division septum initiation protein DivIVA
VDTFRYLERMEELVENSKKFLGFFRFDDEEFYMLVQQARASLPEDLRRAGAISDRKDEILMAAQSESERRLDTARRSAADLRNGAESEAQAVLNAARGEAERLLATAREEASRIVSESEVAKLAQVQARGIVAGAEADAAAIRSQAQGYVDDMRAGADEYARETLAKLEQVIGDTQLQFDERVASVRRGVQMGRQALDPTVPGTGPVRGTRDPNVTVGFSASGRS